MAKTQSTAAPRALRKNSREAILDAAEQVVLSDGAQALTLDEAAKRAGVSKGGLFYHFSSKEDLLKGMVARLVDRADEEEEAYSEALGGGIDARVRAAIAQALREDFGSDRLAAALLAAIANDIRLLAPVRPAIEERFQSLKQCKIGFAAAATIDLAITGLSLLEILGLRPFGPEDRKILLQTMDKMAGGDGIVALAKAPTKNQKKTKPSPKAI